MVDFRCAQISSKELIKCTFGLNKTELRIFLFLLGNTRSVTNNDIASELELDRTTIQKSIQGLVKRDIVIRRQINLDTGGYVFYYFVKDKTLLKEQMNEIINNWTNISLKQLDDIFK